MQPFQTIEIEMRGVQHHVIHAFTNNMKEITDYTQVAIKAAFKKLLSTGHLENKILEAVSNTMHELLTNHIDSAVQDAVSEYINSKEGRQQIVESIMKGLVK